MSDAAHAVLAELYRSEAPLITVYADASEDSNDPHRTRELRRRALREELAAAGAPNADLDIVDEILSRPTHVGNPVSHFLVIRNGEVLVQELLPGQPRAQHAVSYGLVPGLIPLVMHRPRDLSYLVVEANREGGVVKLFRLGGTGPEAEREIEGETEQIRKVQMGGWSHRRFQQHAEETWKRNEAQIAESIDELVRTEKVELVLISGDVRATQLLRDQLSSAAQKVAVLVAGNTRAEGSSDQPLEQELETRIAELLALEERNALDRLAQETASTGGLGEVGLGAVVHALQQSQVDTLLVSQRLLGDRTLLALATEPWLATAPEEALGATVVGHVPAADALVRAAVLTDAKVIALGDQEVPQGVAALLRWPTGPAARND
jgi:Bacterial archaeo-eukaryotic release factor family 2